MTLAELQKLVKYVTDTDGKRSAVLVPTEIWDQVLAVLETESGLGFVDEAEPKAKILADLEEAVRGTKAGETFPVAELWNRVYE